jgi:hypothetical protein
MEMDKVKRLFSVIFANVLSNFFWVVLTSMWYYILTHIGDIKAFFDRYMTGAGTYALIAAILLTVLAVTGALIRKNAFRQKPIFPYINYDFRTDNIEAELEFVTRERVLYRVKYRIKAKREVKEFIGRTIWTGSSLGHPAFYHNPSGHTVEDIKEQELGSSCKVTFASPLKKGETTEFGIVYECGDEAHIMNPHLGFKIKWPTSRLFLRILTRGELIRNVTRCVFATEDNDFPLTRSVPIAQKTVGEYAIYEGEYKKPILFHTYRFDWKFK